MSLISQSNTKHKEKLKEVNRNLAKEDNRGETVQDMLAYLKEYGQFDELTTEAVNRFISKITVHEDGSLEIFIAPGINIDSADFQEFYHQYKPAVENYAKRSMETEG